MSVGVPLHGHPIKKSSARLYKSVQRARLTIFKMGPWTARKSDTGRTLGGPYGIRHLAVLLIENLENGLPLRLNEIEEFVNPLREPIVVAILWVLLGLSFYSYHVRELLICWLFFSLLFVLLALVILGRVLAGYSGKICGPWAGTAMRLTL